jgi:hypothetical protein
MSEQPTPETDAAVTTFSSISKLKRRFECSTGKVSAEFARRLERERDEAREDAKALAERLTALELSSTADLATLERERDEARVKLITPQKNTPVAEYFSSSSTPETYAAVLSSEGQWSFALKETCQKLERERDEAREYVDRYRERLDLTPMSWEAAE